ncbi:MAG: hypothetical protein J6M14_07855 [Campylobacter sp.]|nr:hypothetical protein [Campylobacter sp.]
MNFIDRIIGKEYSKTELQSFSSMNIILAFVLFFFAFHGLGFLSASYMKKPPHKLEEMQMLTGQIIKVNNKVVGKEDHRRIEFLDTNNTTHIVFYGNGIYHTYDDYLQLVGKKVKIWFPTQEPDMRLIEQIQYADNDKYFFKYKYDGRMEYYDYITSDYYRNTYKKWGGGALALLILQTTLTILIKRRRNVILDRVS